MMTPKVKLFHSEYGFNHWIPEYEPPPSGLYGDDEAYDIPDDYAPMPVPEPEPEKIEDYPMSLGTHQDFSDENMVHRHFPSLDDLKRAMIAPVNEERWEWSQRNTRKNVTTREWWGVNSRDEALKLFEDGWPEGLARIRDLVNKLKAFIKRPPGKRRRKRRGPMGDELDIHAVYRGDLPRAWTRTQLIEPEGVKEGRKVSIIVEMSASWVTPADQLFWRPATALALMELLLKGGYSVEVIAAKTSLRSFSDDKPPSQFCGTITLKSFNQTINPELLAGSALGAFFRIYGFKTLVTVDRKAARGFGHATTMPDDCKFLKQRGGHLIHIKDVFSESAAVAFIKKHVAPLT